MDIPHPTRHDAPKDRAIAERLGRNLFVARRHAGFSQGDLASRCSLHRTCISLLERGHRLPRVDTLMKLTGALGISIDRMLRGLN